MKLKRDKVEDLRIIKNFLKKITTHDADTAKITPGRKSTYKCTVINRDGNKVSVNFWLYDTDIAYGVVGYGVISCQPIEWYKYTSHGQVLCKMNEKNAQNLPVSGIINRIRKKN